MDLEEKSERLQCLSEKIDNMLMRFVGTLSEQERRLARILRALLKKVTQLHDEVRNKINNDKKLPF